MFQKKFSLAYQLRLAFLTVPILLIIAITVYSGFNLVSNNNRIKAATATQVSQSVIEKIDRNFYERFGDVQAYAVNPSAVQTALTDTISPEAQSFINTMTTYYVLYDLMMVVNAEGKVVACNTVDKDGNSVQTAFLLGKDFSKTDWFKQCTTGSGPEGGAWYSDFQMNTDVARIYNSKGMGMAFAAPMRDEQGTVVGIWYNFASWKEVTQGIRKEALAALRKSEPGGEIFVLNVSNQIIDASEEDLIFKQEIEKANLDKENIIIHSEKGKIHTKDYMYGQAHSSGAYTFKGKNWRCITLIPKATVTLAAFFTKELIIIDVLFLFLAIYVANTISKGLIHKIYQLKSIINQLSIGDLNNTQVTVHGNDELAEMGNSVVTLASRLNHTSRFAEEVGKGNFEAKFTPLSEIDTLGNALIKMNANLKAASDEDKKRNWTTEGMAKFAEILRADTHLDSLANHIIASLVQYVKANQGGLFILNENDKHAPKLELIACYAYDKKKFINKTIEAGDGLLGQAFLEKATVYRTDIPTNYIRITSGLGDSNPGCLLIVPLQINGKVEGVIEIASFSAFEDYQIAFVEKLAETIAAALSSVKVNEQTKKLLEKSQQQAEELRAQEEEMRQNMEELHAIQEEMGRKQTELSGQIAALNHAAIVSEVDLKGNILTVNDEFCRISKYSKEELVGQKQSIVRHPDMPATVFDDLWATILKGKVWKGEIKNRAKDGSYYWVAATITPVLNEQGRPVKFIGVRFDITLQKDQEEKTKKDFEHLKNQYAG